LPYLKTLGKAMQPTSYGSLSPDEMKTYSKKRVNDFGLHALTRAQTGTSQRAPMPKARRELFRQRYYKAARPAADYTLGDQFGVQSRKESSSGAIQR
jgi:hypothetical protein